MMTDFQLGNRCLVAKDYARAIEHFVRHAAWVPAEAGKAHAAAAECNLRSNVISTPVIVARGVKLVSQRDLRGGHGTASETRRSQSNACRWPAKLTSMRHWPEHIL